MAVLSLKSIMCAAADLGLVMRFWADMGPGMAKQLAPRAARESSRSRMARADRRVAAAANLVEANVI